MFRCDRRQAGRLLLLMRLASVRPDSTSYSNYAMDLCVLH